MSASQPQRRREREFGVPIPGEILSPEQWTQTGLKKLPVPDGDWSRIFGRAAPLVVDLGCGNGRFLLTSSIWRPDHDHIGIDPLSLVIRYATRRANQRGLNNVRFAVSGGLEFLRDHLASQSVQEVHCYHPQPYYKPEEKPLRLVTPLFLSQVVRVLRPGGKFFIQTDNPAYWKYILEIVPRFFDLQEFPGRWPDAPKGRTRREIIALREGLPVSRGAGEVLPGLDFDSAVGLAQTLPAPLFDATRDTAGLDKLEISDQD